jgi:hypothetical protein
MYAIFLKTPKHSSAVKNYVFKKKIKGIIMKNVMTIKLMTTIETRFTTIDDSINDKISDAVKLDWDEDDGILDVSIYDVVVNRDLRGGECEACIELDIEVSKQLEDPMKFIKFDISETVAYNFSVDDVIMPK